LSEHICVQLLRYAIVFVFSYCRFQCSVVCKFIDWMTGSTRWHRP